MNSSMINFLNAAARMEELEFDSNQIKEDNYNKNEGQAEEINKLKYFPRKNNKNFNIFNDKQSRLQFEEGSNLNTQERSSIDTLLPNEVFDPNKEGEVIPEEQKTSAINYQNKSIAEKIQAIFNLKVAEELFKEFPCWLMSTVLLQGNLYLTENHLLYYATIPRNKNEIIKSGFLTKKTNPAYSTIYWFILRDYSLSYFEDSTDVYCPYGMIDLKSVLSIQRSNSKPFGFKIITVNKKYTLNTDSEISLKEWINAVKKAVFKAKHNDHIKIVIPLGSVVDAELNATFNFAETLRIKSVEANFAMDDHYFVFFEKGEEALKSCQECVREYYIKHPESQNNKISNNFGLNQKDNEESNSRSIPIFQIDSKAQEELSDALNSDINKQDNLLSPTSILRFVPKQLRLGQKSKSNNSSRRSSMSDFNPDDFMTYKYCSSDDGNSDEGNNNRVNNKVERNSNDNLSTSNPIQISIHSETSERTKDNNRHIKSSSSLDFKLSNWIKFPNITTTIKSSLPNKFGPFEISNKNDLDYRNENNSPSSPLDNYLSEVNESNSFFNLPNINTPSLETLLPNEQNTFKEFALPSSEKILISSGCLLLRVVPRWGRLLITSNFVCFYSRLVGMTIKVLVPIQDIRKTENQPGLRLLHHGLSLETINSQEIFLEFRSSKTRENILTILLNQMHLNNEELIDNNLKNSKLTDPTNLEMDNNILNQHNKWIQEYDVNNNNLPLIPKDPNQLNKILSNISPFGKMHITCLTIGTRGDVQPYIALCKGLMKHGHTCRIATHEEYKEWIESHNIEFRVIAGDPGELIKLCVDNNMLSFNFWKQGVNKFRSWIDELLDTSWDACQNTDILIESPTAMAGIHIAEKLNIPFFGCFTMPWTRTRAFPHPFAIPEHQVGGSYNYMTYVLIEQVLWKGTSWQINNWRKKKLNLPSTSLEMLNQHRVPYLYSFSPAIAPPPFDWHDWIHTCGFFFLDDPTPGWTPDPELIKFLEEGDKPIYIGFGSITIPDPKETIKIIIEASIQAKVKIILSEGWSNRMVKEQGNEPIQYPENILKINNVPHDWLFPKVLAVMHHGGAGTTAAGLRAGVPTIIKPFFGDQYFWAMQVERMNTGVYLRKLTTSKLAQALKDVHDDKMIEKAAAVGRQIKSENGVENAINFIYRDLEYSKGRINKEQPNNTVLSENEDETHSDLGWFIVNDKNDKVEIKLC